MARIVKEVSSVIVEFAGNGVLIEYSGRLQNDDYATDKRVFIDILEALDFVEEIYTHANEYH